MDLRGCELASLRKNDKVIEEIERHEEKQEEKENNDQIAKPTVATNTLSPDLPVIEEVITDETLVITDKNTFHKTTTNSPELNTESSHKNSEQEDEEAVLIDIVSSDDDNLKKSSSSGFTLDKFFMDLQQKQNYAIILAIACSIFAFTFAICFCMVCYCLACKNRNTDKSDTGEHNHPHPSLKSYDPEATMRYNQSPNPGMNPLTANSPLLNLRKVPDEDSDSNIYPTSSNTWQRRIRPNNDNTSAYEAVDIVEQSFPDNLSPNQLKHTNSQVLFEKNELDQIFDTVQRRADNAVPSHHRSGSQLSSNTSDLPCARSSGIGSYAGSTDLKKHA